MFTDFWSKFNNEIYVEILFNKQTNVFVYYYENFSNVYGICDATGDFMIIITSKKSKPYFTVTCL